MPDENDAQAPPNHSIPMRGHAVCTSGINEGGPCEVIVDLEHGKGAPDSEFDSYLCKICLDDIEATDRTLTHAWCISTFHESCLVEWLSDHDTCPICRDQENTRLLPLRAPPEATRTPAAAPASVGEVQRPQILPRPAEWLLPEELRFPEEARRLQEEIWQEEAQRLQEEQVPDMVRQMQEEIWREEAQRLQEALRRREEPFPEELRQLQEEIWRQEALRLQEELLREEEQLSEAGSRSIDGQEHERYLEEAQTDPPTVRDDEDEADEQPARFRTASSSSDHVADEGRNLSRDPVREDLEALLRALNINPDRR